MPEPILGGAPERHFTRVGSVLTQKHCTWLDWPVRDKRSSVLSTIVTHRRKKFCIIWPWWRCCKLVSLCHVRSFRVS